MVPDIDVMGMYIGLDTQEEGTGFLSLDQRRSIRGELLGKDLVIRSPSTLVTAAAF